MKAKAKPEASPANKGEEGYFVEKKYNIGRVVLNESPLEKSKSSG